MKYLLSLLCLFFIFVSTVNLSAQSCQKLIWSEEFDGAELNTDNWNYDLGNGCPELCGWGNNEKQYYTDNPENISVNNGILTITAKEEMIGGLSYSSAKITTKEKADFRYGRIDSRIRLPETQGLWPAFWMLSTDNVYGTWPQSGEIDILELLGHKPNEVLGTIHTGLPWVFNSETYALDETESFADDFHTFSLEWNPDTIRWFIDDILYHEVNSSEVTPWIPFQEDFHLILNIAVGGNLPGDPDATTLLPQVMEVDWIRVYNSPDLVSINGEQPVQGALGTSFQVFEMEDANYVWTVPSGSTIVSGQGSPEIVVVWGCDAGDVMLELQTDCDTAIITYPIATFTDLSIAGNTIVEQNQTGLEFEIPQVAGGTYTWTVPNGASIESGQGTNSIVVDWACEAGEVSVSTTGDCGTLSASLPVELQTYSISGFAFVPANGSGQNYSIDNVSDVSYEWSVPSDATIVSGQGTNAISVDFGEQGGAVSVAVSNSCGTETFVRTITIDPSNIYCDFDGTDLEWDIFGGTAVENKIPNPFQDGINVSDHVGKTRKNPGAQDWGGIFADLGGEMDLIANPFLHMKVRSEKTGVVKFKLEDQTTAVSPVEIDLNYETPNEWMNIVWDYNGNPAETFDRIALFFDFGSTDTSYWYFDDVIGRETEIVATSDIKLNPIKVFPNPLTGQVTVELNGAFSEEKNFKMQIIRPNGQVVIENIYDRQTDKFITDLSGLSNGNYLMRLIGRDLQYVKAIVKME